MEATIGSDIRGRYRVGYNADAWMRRGEEAQMRGSEKAGEQGGAEARRWRVSGGAGYWIGRLLLNLLPLRIISVLRA
jgi:hypothetical protein